MSNAFFHSLLTIDVIGTTKNLKNRGGTHYPIEQVLPWLAHRQMGLVTHSLVSKVLPTVEVNIEIAIDYIRKDLQERGGIRKLKELLANEGQIFLGYLIWTNNGNGTAKVSLHNHLGRDMRGEFMLVEEKK